MATAKAHEIAARNLRPFIAAVFMQSVDATEGRALATSLLEEVSGAIGDSGGVQRNILHTNKPAKYGGLHIASVIFRERNRPAWLAEGSLKDVNHHLAVLAISGRMVALVVSAGGVRDAMVKKITSARTVDRSAMEAAFVGTQAKTVWLTGVHVSTSVKADSKTLMGSALEHALDPLGDQTYALSAVRSTPAISFSSSGPRTVGVAPGPARVWLGRPPTWGDFAAQIESLLGHLSAPAASTSPFSFLSQPAASLVDVKSAYDIAVLPRVLFDDDADQVAREIGERWAYEAKYAVTPRIGASLAVDVVLGGTSIGVVELDVNMTSSGKITLAPTWTGRNISQELRDECQQIFADPLQIKIYYEGGRAIADGQCFVLGWTDNVFDWSFENFAGYDVSKEKPELAAGVALADAIGVGGDDSLFAFIRQRFSTGWLACDDGALEVGDFIHFDGNTLTLIHAKGSGTAAPTRQVSVSDYEIVASQGVKNVRHFDKEMLVSRLSSGNKDIARATWKDGVRQTDRKGLITELKKPAGRIKCTLMIIQPRLTKAAYDRCIAGSATAPEALRFKQLNALMLSARIAAMGVGAELIALAGN